MRTHKRSSAKQIVIPFPDSSSLPFIDEPTMSPPASLETKDKPRWSGESLAPSDGYSGLFTSGIMQLPSTSPTLSSFPTVPTHQPQTSSSSTSSSSYLQAPSKTPSRRRRSSIIHATAQSTSPMKFKSGGAESALEGVMRSLKIVTPLRGSKRDESRWSSSSDESQESWFGKTRKSGESSRSTTAKSIRSKMSFSSLRRSEDTDRMDVDIEEHVPPVPPMVPLTPGKSRRLMDGLVKRLGLTPKQSKMSMGPPLPTPLTHLPLPLPPPPMPRNLPRKSSLSTLRSHLSKKSSTTTIRSTHPFMSSASPTMDCGSAPPLPELPQPVPKTPTGRRTPKSSIGNPRYIPDNSPSLFLREMPRRAPTTPKRSATPPRSSTLQETSVATPELVPANSVSTPDSDFVFTPDAHSSFRPLTIKQQKQLQGEEPLKPLRLLSLLPRNQKSAQALGMQTPPAKGLRGHTDSPSPYTRLLEAHSATNKETKTPSRDPLGILSRSRQNQMPGMKKQSMSPGFDLPFRSGAGDGWSTPALEREKAGEGTFGMGLGKDDVKEGRRAMEKGRVAAEPTMKKEKRRGELPVDFTASPSVSMEGQEVEEWELERYLRHLEARERGMARV
ncbi:hypothetical protein P7C73_g2278, partial [Tremellales sp. Uapishka_1]